MPEKRAKTPLALMDSQPWDFCMMVLLSTDRMGHYRWPYHRSPASDDSPEVQELCRAVHRHYVRLDELIGEFIAKAGEDVSVIVMSDHGMGPRYTKRVHCNYWLQQRGWLQTQSSGGQSLTNADSWLKRLGVPRDKIGRLMFRLPRFARSRILKQAVKSRAAAVDMERSKAYCVPIYDNIAGIRINLTGEAKDRLCQEIMRELPKITDPKTGESVIVEICRGEEYYYGPYAQNIPDLIVTMKPEYGFGYQISNYSSVVTEIIANARQQGDHRLDGILIVNGPEIEPNAEPLTNLAI
jgi:predicted AlkP superfamily phosphohydrolase/phosphomutase